MPPTEYKFYGLKVEVFSDSCLTVYDDGRVVPATPHDTDEYRATAARFGYNSDTLTLCIDHEIMHHALANFLGTDSPTLRAVSRGVDDRGVVNQLEETAVLAVQNYANALGIRIQEVFKR